MSPRRCSIFSASLAERLRGGRLGEAFDRLSTSYKVLLLLTLALLPLGVVALLASVQSVKATDRAHRAEMADMVGSAARSLAQQLGNDSATLSLHLDAINAGADVASECRAAFAAFNSRVVKRPFDIYDGSGTRLCSLGQQGSERLVPELLDQRRPLILADGIVVLRVGRPGQPQAVIHYTPGTLGQLVDWLTELSSVRSIILDVAGQSLPIITRDGEASLNPESYSASLPFAETSLRLETRPSAVGFAQLLLTLLPILMWLAAAVIGFIVVDRLLVRPLRALRTAVDRQRHGEAVQLPAFATPATEINELRQAFGDYAEAQATHETDLNHALERQTRLTREVHHRVKNNLQVIASLISLHSRAAEGADAASAYNSISRRVDALAIVHRNHYSRLDEGGALDLKPMLSELVANLRNAGGKILPLSLQAEPLSASLDTATTLAFLMTELVELACEVDPTLPVALIVRANDSTRGQLTVESMALRAATPSFAHHFERYSRVLTGLSRQLRQTLHHDAERGRYDIEYPIVEKT